MYCVYKGMITAMPRKISKPISLNSMVSKQETKLHLIKSAKVHKSLQSPRQSRHLEIVVLQSGSNYV